jgi:hypothetical protein
MKVSAPNQSLVKGGQAKAGLAPNTVEETEEMSVFNGATPSNPQPLTKVAGTAFLVDIIEEIKDDAYADKVKKVREQERKSKAHDKAKLALGSFTVSGVFSKKRAGFPETHTGLIQGDVDGKDHPDLTVEEMRAKVINHRSLVACFTSPSGDGLKLIMKTGVATDKADHVHRFESMKTEMTRLGLKVDASCKDPARLCFYSHDPDAFYRPPHEAEAIPLIPKTTEPDHREWQGDGISYPLPVAKRALEAIEEKIGRPPYELWLGLTAGMSNSYGSEGLCTMEEVFPEEREGEYQHKLPHLPEAHSTGYVFNKAKELASWEASPEEKADLKERLRTGSSPFSGIRIHRTVKGSYLMQNKISGNWESVTIAEARQTLALEGLADTQGKGDNRIITNEIKTVIESARHEGSIAGSLQLAGRSRGLLKLPSGDHILIPKEKVEIIPVKGEWPVTKALLGLMFPTEEGAKFQQYDIGMGWIAWAWRSYRDEIITPGQILHIAGGSGAYKTMLKESVLAPLFGGGVGQLNPHLRRTQEFNSDLFTDFLLGGDDPPTPSSGEILDPNFFKGIAVTSHKADCHAKFMDRVTVPALRRGLLLTNTAKDDLKVIPAFADGMVDKFICLYSMAETTLIVDGFHFETEEDVAKALRSETAAFAYALENWSHKFQTTDKERKKEITRYSVPSFKHPLVLDALREASGAQSSMNVIFTAVWSGDFENDDVMTKRFKAGGLLTHGEMAHRAGKVGFWGWESAKSLGKSLAEISTTSDLLTSVGKGRNTKWWHFNKPSPEQWDDISESNGVVKDDDDINF